MNFIENLENNVKTTTENGAVCELEWVYFRQGIE